MRADVQGRKLRFGVDETIHRKAKCNGVRWLRRTSA